MEYEAGQSSQTIGTRFGRVVIVDDDPVCLATLERTFRDHNVQTTSFEDGAEAWRAIQEKPDVFMVVANWMLPNLDGHRICRRLAQQRPAIATVLMVGQHFLSETWPRMRLQSDYILPKPFPKAGIDEQIRRIIKLASHRDASRRYCTPAILGFAREPRITSRTLSMRTFAQ